MDIQVKTIPHSTQRYDTSGDWWPETIDGKETLQIRVSALGDPYLEFLVAFHELAEAMLCRRADISEESVSNFDRGFEHLRKLGHVSEDAEPGDASDAPYRQEHFFATAIEMLMAQKLGVDWNEYSGTINVL